MLRLLAAHGARWLIPIRDPRGLSYRRIVATGIARSMAVLATYDDVETASSLLAADPDLADDTEALEAAARGGRLDFVRLLLRHRPDVARRVTVSKPEKAARLLFEHGMDANRADWLGITPLHRFAERGDLASARLFIEHGARLDARDQELQSTPVAYAARAGHLRMVRFLLDQGALVHDPEDPPWATPLAWARRRGHARVVALLEKRGAS
jgi:ankyrin repeat protein